MALFSVMSACTTLPSTSVTGTGPGLTGQTGTSGCTVSAELVPTCGAWWGSHSSMGWPAFESMVGRSAAIVHDYFGWNEIFPNRSEELAAAGGRIVFVDWTAKNFQTSEPATTWAQIASGADDGQIDLEAAALKAFGKPIMVTFFAEPDQPAYSVYGDATQYAAAWRHIYLRMAADGVRNVVWVWDVTGDFTDRGAAYAKWYPGDPYVNWIMWDPYNWYGCNGGGSAPFRSFAQIVSGMYTWLENHSDSADQHDYLSKPWGLAEFGTVEGPRPDSKEQWLESVPATAESRFPRLKALVYFNSTDSSRGRTCNWRVDSSADSLAGYRLAGTQPYVARLP